MCGISGILSGTTVSHEVDVASMNRQQGRRGPDDTGIYTARGVNFCCTLGHTRLAILDREGGAQPMVCPESGAAITFNGEIYNHPALRRELETAGCCFRSRSDTEVLLQGYLHWGIDRLLGKADGMFAFAIADPRNNLLLLARDPAGQKPLYYSSNGNDNLFAFASTVGAVATVPWFNRAIDEDAVELFLNLRVIPAPYSIYKKTRKLPPGCYLVRSQSGTTVKEYWSPFSPRQQENATGESELLEEYRTLLRSSLTQTVAADEPVSLMLSSGIDSASLACELGRLPEKDLITAYTVSFPEKAFDEANMAATIAGRHNLAHRVLHFDNPDFRTQLAVLCGLLDEPFGDPSILPCLQLCRAVAANSRVAITGDGADELFGGYPTFGILPLWPLINSLPALARGLCALLHRLLPDGSSGYPLAMKIQRLSHGLGHDDAMAFARWLCIFPPEESAALLGKKGTGVFTNFVSSSLAGLPDEDSISMMCRTYFRLFLPGVLEKMDRAAMHYSLETRAPFLQRRLMEFALKLPSRYKLRLGTGKYLMRRSLADQLPAEVVNAGKRGFTPPLAAEFAGEWGAEAGSLLTTACDSFGLDRVIAGRMLKEHRAGQRDHSRKLWLICQLALFQQNSRLTSTPPAGDAS